MIYSYLTPITIKRKLSYLLHGLLNTRGLAALLKIINEVSYCIFIESSESLNLARLGKKKTFSPWLYEELEYMKALAPQEPKVKIFCKAVTEAQDFKMEYDVPELENFAFLDYDDFLQLKCRTNDI